MTNMWRQQAFLTLVQYSTGRKNRSHDHLRVWGHRNTIAEPFAKSR